MFAGVPPTAVQQLLHLEAVAAERHFLQENATSLDLGEGT
jgi:hypothetical protein